MFWIVISLVSHIQTQLPALQKGSLLQRSRLSLAAQRIDVPHSLSELENVLAGRERTDDGENSRAGFGVR